jgi:hypothetical protein
MFAHSRERNAIPFIMSKLMIWIVQTTLVYFFYFYHPSRIENTTLLIINTRRSRPPSRNDTEK